MSEKWKNVRKNQEILYKHALNIKVYHHYKPHIANVIKKAVFATFFFQVLINFLEQIKILYDLTCVSTMW